MRAETIKKFLTPAEYEEFRKLRKKKSQTLNDIVRLYNLETKLESMKEEADKKKKKRAPLKFNGPVFFYVEMYPIMKAKKYTPKDLLSPSEYKEFQALCANHGKSVEQHLRFNALQRLIISRRKQRLERHYGCGFDHD